MNSRTGSRWPAWKSKTPCRRPPRSAAWSWRASSRSRRIRTPTSCASAGGRRLRRAAADRLRRVQRGRRPDRAAGPRRRRAARRHEDRRGQDARCAIVRHAVLARAGPVPGSRRPDGTVRRPGSRPVDPRRADLDDTLFTLAHAEPRRLSVDPGVAREVAALTARRCRCPPPRPCP